MIFPWPVEIKIDQKAETDCTQPEQGCNGPAFYGKKHNPEISQDKHYRRYRVAQCFVASFQLRPCFP